MPTKEIKRDKIISNEVCMSLWGEFVKYNHKLYNHVIPQCASHATEQNHEWTRWGFWGLGGVVNYFINQIHTYSFSLFPKQYDSKKTKGKFLMPATENKDTSVRAKPSLICIDVTNPIFYKMYPTGWCVYFI